MHTYFTVMDLKTDLYKSNKGTIKKYPHSQYYIYLWSLCIIYIFNIYITVVSASLEFMDSDTMISEKKDVSDAVQSITAMRKTPLLCQVTDPEEKRKIIGDTFMRVANEVQNI